MATIHSAAARDVRRSIAFAVLAGFLAIGASGCSTGGNSDIFSSLGEQPGTATANGTSAPSSTKGKVAIAPIIGPPQNVSKQLTTQLTSALKQGGIAVVPSTVSGSSSSGAVASDYTLRGYIVAAKESAGTKVSYIWDVANPAGVRVNRITGEEVVAGAAGSNPWASVSPQVLQRIASKTATSMSAWMPSKQPAKPPPAAKPPAATPTPVAGSTASKTTRTAAATGASSKTKASTTGSIPRANSALAVYVPRVSGAPGDGPSALSQALQRELTKNGVSLANSTAATSAHRVEGKVALGASKGGKQPISIDWVVKDPKGNKLGTVSQKNDIPAGSLNGKWGATAGAAAAAAAQGILRLLPRKTSS